MRNIEKRIRRKILPELKGHLMDLSKLMEEHNLIVFEKASTKSNLKESERFSKSEVENFKSDLNTFKNMIINICNSDEFSLYDAKNHFSKMIDSLRTESIYSATYFDNTEVLAMMEKSNSLFQDDESIPFIQRRFAEAGIDLKLEISKLLEGYTKFRLDKVFTKRNINLSKLPLSKRVFGMVYDYPLNNEDDLVFFIKESRNEPYQVNREDIFSCYEYLKEIDDAIGTESTHIVLVSYSNISVEQSSIIEFKFLQLLRELNIDDRYRNRIHVMTGNLYNPTFIEVSIKNLFTELLTFSFNHTFLSNEEILNNHSLLPNSFLASNKEFNIVVTPLETQFWRFGLFLTDEKKFEIPNSTLDRHSNQNTTDIHLCIGDMLEDRSWINPNHLSLAAYKEVKNGGEIRSYLHYKETPIYIRIVIRKGELTISVRVETESLGTKRISLNKKYIYFGAWCDYRKYNLSTQFKVTRA